MLRSIQFQNFRCFLEHEISFTKLCLLVGRNNAGKSTVVDALRLVSLVTARYQTSNYSDVPSWLDAPQRERGFSPSLRGYPLNLETVFHRYSDPPAVLKATFDSGESIKVYIGQNSLLHAVIFDAKDHTVLSKKSAQNLSIPQLGILPQITPVVREEPLLDQEYVLRSVSSNLSSLHFRNELYHYPAELYQRFKKLAEESWPQLQVNDLKTHEENNEHFIHLYVRDGPFVAEVGAMGHGLQMWLQVM